MDTGADVTVIPIDDLKKLGLERKDIQKTKKRLFGPGRERLQCLGYVKATFTWGNIKDTQIIYVCDGIKRALLGKPAIRKLKTAELQLPHDYQCTGLNEPTKEIREIVNNTIDNKEYFMLTDFPQIHQGLGKINVDDPIKIKLKKGTIPHQTYSPRAIPIPLIEKVTEKLHEMLDLKVIRKIDHLTEWCHPIVVVTKPSGGYSIMY